MKINNDLLPQAITAELSQRFKQYRIDYPMTRGELSEKSMVSIGTIARFENGHDIGLLNVVRIMKALGIESNLDVLIPDPSERPSYHISGKKPKQRVRKSAKKENSWKWGDEK